MALIVQKFGGTSVGNLTCLQQVVGKITQAREQGHDVVVVVSAMHGETDRLINLARQIHDDPEPREYAALVATGEQVSTALLTIALSAQGYPARSYTGAQARIQTDLHHKKARILSVDGAFLKSEIKLGRIPVVAGFQGVSEEGDITTLGRGGSDTTAVALAAALKADECQIYTDVDGVYTADPRVVPTAQRLEEISVEEMLEFASSGAKVLQQRAVEFAEQYQVPIRVLSTFDEGSGTLVRFSPADHKISAVKGIAISRHEVQFSIKGLSAQGQAFSELLDLLQTAQVDVDMLTQQLDSSGYMDIAFSVTQDDALTAKEIIEPFAQKNGAKWALQPALAKLSLIGSGLQSQAVIIGTLFKTMGAVNITPWLVSTSEVKISVLVEGSIVEQGARVLHDAFGLSVVSR